MDARAVARAHGRAGATIGVVAERVYLFGGADALNLLADTWLYDYRGAWVLMLR